MRGQLIIPRINKYKILSRVEKINHSGCWEWQGNINDNGYGRIGINKKNYYVHRVSYDLFFGITNLDNVIDHICRNRKCCNPDHLREVDSFENVIENSESLPSKRFNQKECLRGHLLSGENVYKYKNKRYCKSCRADYHKTYKR